MPVKIKQKAQLQMLKMKEKTHKNFIISFLCVLLFLQTPLLPPQVTTMLCPWPSTATAYVLGPMEFQSSTGGVVTEEKAILPLYV